MAEPSQSLINAYEAAIIVILFAGLILNGTILVMFILHKEIRKSSNLMIFSLAFCSVQYVIVTLYFFTADFVLTKDTYYIPHYFVDSYYTLVSVSSVMHYSTQRYIAVSKTMQDSDSPQLMPCIKTTCQLLTVWWMSLGFCVVMYFILTYSMSGNFRPVYFGIISFINIIVLPLYVSVYNVLTRRKFILGARTTQDRDNKQAMIRSRYRNSRMLVDLTIAHVSSYPWMSIAFIAEVMKSDLQNTVVDHIIRLSVLLYYGRSAILPITLYKDSFIFENLFNRYLFRCWYEPQSMGDLEQREGSVSRDSRF